MLALEIPAELFVEHEGVEEGKTHGEAIIPAASLNEHRAMLRRLTADEVDALTLRRFSPARVRRFLREHDQRGARQLRDSRDPFRADSSTSQAE